PRGNHIEVKHSAQCTPIRTSNLQCLNRKEEGDHEEKDGNGFDVVGSSYGTRDVSGRNGNECCCKETGGVALHFLGEEIGCKCCKSGESGSEEDADVSNVDWESEEFEDVVDETGGDHKAGV